MNCSASSPRVLFRPGEQFDRRGRIAPPHQQLGARQHRVEPARHLTDRCELICDPHQRVLRLRMAAGVDPRTGELQLGVRRAVGEPDRPEHSHRVDQRGFGLVRTELLDEDLAEVQRADRRSDRVAAAIERRARGGEPRDRLFPPEPCAAMKPRFPGPGPHPAGRRARRRCRALPAGGSRSPARAPRGRRRRRP